ncbi:hypothetical protein PsorP6_012120 [Peronosclerospora sorghi]|uniref:Uncharacterized protein n=1 Tax=Peronosclerospora sorghi TaxID=230839 RepID=A0ACC0WN86_9STRA|nr:hypothetical protein PsorP6_012120 [Peronosclerospora sorghi]
MEILQQTQRKVAVYLGARVSFSSATSKTIFVAVVYSCGSLGHHRVRSLTVPAKWRVIPHHVPHADTTVISSSSTSTSAKLPPSGVMHSELTAPQKIHYATRKMAEERNYIQYGKHLSKGCFSNVLGSCKYQKDGKWFNTVLEPTGRRPFMKSVHQTTEATLDLASKQQPQKDATIMCRMHR